MSIDWPVVAAFAQAVLSGAAVFLAAWLHDRSAQRREQADLKRRMNALSGLLHEARNAIRESREILTKMKVADFQKAATTFCGGPPSPFVPLPDKAAMEQLAQALGEIRLHELPSWPIASATLTIRKALADCLAQTTIILQRASAGGLVESEVLSGPQSAAREALMTFQTELERLLA